MEEKVIEGKWIKDMAFDVSVEGHVLRLDAEAKVGGQDTGPRPKPMLLVALLGCTGMDVIYFLRKMRSEPKSFSLKVTGKLRDEHPKFYEEITVDYYVSDDISKDNFVKSVNLSKDKYCGVYEVFRRAGIKIYWNMYFGDNLVESGVYNA